MNSTNPYGWPTPLTDEMLADLIIPVLPTPAESIAERLTMLAHRCFNAEMWGSGTGRLATYWVGFGNRIESSTNEISVARWWEAMMRDLAGTPIRDLDLLNEKNLLIRPSQLPNTPVDDEDVLDILRLNSLELRDRTRRWAKDRRDAAQADRHDPDEQDF